MYTVMTKGTGERVHFPNTRLLTLPIANLSRTQHRAESVSLAFDLGAPALAAREALMVRHAGGAHPSACRGGWLACLQKHTKSHPAHVHTIHTHTYATNPP